MVLVVEDDAEYRWMISARLGEAFEVLEAADGREGVEKALKHIPDLVVTDLMMPGMSGIELCRELKANVQTSHIPVIMLTAKNSVESQIEGLETGADDYITKPFTMELLKARIRNLLKSRHMLRERFGGEFIHAGILESSLKSSVDRALWERILSLLKENYPNPDFSPEEMAEALHISKRTLQRKIKALTDRSPVGLILQYRLKLAAQLLKQPSLKITDVAFDVGFSDSNHFSRQFKKEFGKTPSEFRAEAVD